MSSFFLLLLVLLLLETILVSPKILLFLGWKRLFFSNKKEGGEEEEERKLWANKLWKDFLSKKRIIKNKTFRGSRKFFFDWKTRIQQTNWKIFALIIGWKLWWFCGLHSSFAFSRNSTDCISFALLMLFSRFISFIVLLVSKQSTKFVDPNFLFFYFYFFLIFSFLFFF